MEYNKTEPKPHCYSSPNYYKNIININKILRIKYKYLTFFCLVSVPVSYSKTERNMQILLHLAGAKT